MADFVVQKDGDIQSILGGLFRQLLCGGELAEIVLLNRQM